MHTYTLGLAMSLDMVMFGFRMLESTAVSQTQQNISKGGHLLDNGTDIPLLKHSAVNLLD